MSCEWAVGSMTGSIGAPSCSYVSTGSKLAVAVSSAASISPVGETKSNYGNIKRRQNIKMRGIRTRKHIVSPLFK